jgi:hypothetical protein
MSPVRYELGFYIPEDRILHSHRRERLKSCKKTHGVDMAVRLSVKNRASGSAQGRVLLSPMDLFQNVVLWAKKCTSRSSVASGMQWEGHGHETAGLFCTAPHLHIGRWWSKKPPPSLEHPLYSLDLPSPDFCCFCFQNVLRKTIRECRGSQWKSDASTDRGVEICFQECFRKLYARRKIGHYPRKLRELLWRKDTGNRCKATYLCVIN